MRLILIRHGETEITNFGKYIGSTDVALSTEGLRQVQCLRDRLAMENIDYVYSSNLQRALVTAQTIAHQHNLEVTTCSELREIDFGALEGLTFTEVELNYPEVLKQWLEQSSQLNYPNGENFNKVEARVQNFHKRILSHGNKDTVIIVAHSGILRMLLCQLLGQGRKLWWQICLDLASLSIIETYDRSASIMLLNDCSHLKKGQTDE